MQDSRTRFSDRASDYQKYRPTYPAQVIDFVIQHCSPNKRWNIADIGSGTGISSRFLSAGLGCRILAVEPNREMRESAEKAAQGDHLILSVDGSSEATTLDAGSIDLVCSFQSFHWFDRPKSRIEFARILKEPQWVLLVWNDRVTDEPGFHADYDGLLKSLPAYADSCHKNIGLAEIRRFMGDGEILQAQVTNRQEFGLEGLRGRFSSASYTPAVGAIGYEECMRQLRELFDRYNIGGVIEYRYRTEMYLGRMG